VSGAASKISRMCFRFHAVTVALVTTMAAAPPRAQAEPSTSERAIAEQLFERGRAQLDVNEVSAACDSFAESQRLDPGTGTILNLAACHQREGKLASAWVEFRDAVAALHRENRPDRLRYALDRLAEIRPQLAFLTLMVPESPLGHAPVVRLDGRELGPAAWSVAIPIDAGWHEAVAQSEGGGPWRATVNIRNGEHRVVSIPAHVAPAGIAIRDREDVVAAPVASAPVAPPPVAPDRAVKESFDTDRAPRRRRMAGIVVGGLGLAALGVGGYFGVHAAGLWGQRNDHCPMNVCTAEGLQFGERADSAAAVATWTMAGGAVAIGAAAVLFLWPGSKSSTKVARTGPSIETVFIDGKTGLGIGGVF
jgi:hypothetical protein